MDVQQDLEADDRSMNTKAMFQELRQGEKKKRKEKKRHSLNINLERRTIGRIQNSCGKVMRSTLMGKKWMTGRQETGPVGNYNKKLFE